MKRLLCRNQYGVAWLKDHLLSGFEVRGGGVVFSGFIYISNMKIERGRLYWGIEISEC